MRLVRQPGATRITFGLHCALQWWDTYLANTAPRIVRVGCPTPPLLVWTDGAHETEGIVLRSCGAVLYDPRDGALQVFGFRVAETTKALWQDRS